MDVSAGSRNATMDLDDLEQVCRMFLRVFRRTDGPPSPDLLSYWRRLYFGSPAYTPQTGCLVHRTADGRIDATVASIPMTMVACGRELPGRLVSAYMADGVDGDRRAGGKLGMSLRARTQDFAFSDSAVALSADICRAGGGVVLPIQSLEWVCLFRPLRHFALAVERRVPAVRWSGLARLTAPFDAMLAARSKPHPLRAVALEDRPIDREAFLDLAPTLVRHYAVHPRWSPAELGWILDMAAENREHGSLTLRRFVDPRGETVGVSVGYEAANRPAMILNILAREGREGEVVPAVLSGLAARGAASARGMCLPRQIEQFFRIPGVRFRHRAHSQVLTRHADVREALLRGDVYMGGLAGESWSRLLTEHF
jgi:hypothetical protein